MSTRTCMPLTATALALTSGMAVAQTKALKYTHYQPGRDDRPTGFEDVFTKIDMCAEHHRKVGLGEDFVRQFVR